MASIWYPDKTKSPFAATGPSMVSEAYATNSAGRVIGPSFRPSYVSAGGAPTSAVMRMLGVPATQQERQNFYRTVSGGRALYQPPKLSPLTSGSEQFRMRSVKDQRAILAQESAAEAERLRLAGRMQKLEDREAYIRLQKEVQGAKGQAAEGVEKIRQEGQLKIAETKIQGAIDQIDKEWEKRSAEGDKDRSNFIAGKQIEAEGAMKRAVLQGNIKAFEANMDIWKATNLIERSETRGNAAGTRSTETQAQEVAPGATPMPTAESYGLRPADIAGQKPPVEMPEGRRGETGAIEVIRAPVQAALDNIVEWRALAPEDRKGIMAGLNQTEQNALMRAELGY